MSPPDDSWPNRRYEPDRNVDEALLAHGVAERLGSLAESLSSWVDRRERELEAELNQSIRSGRSEIERAIARHVDTHPGKTGGDSFRLKLATAVRRHVARLWRLAPSALSGDRGQRPR